MKTLRYITNKLALVLTGVLLLSGMAACDDKDDKTSIKVNRMMVTDVPDEVISLIEGDTWNTKVTTLPEGAIDADEYTYRYTTGNDKVFTVDENGVITATGIGESVLTVWSVNNTDMWTTCLVKVEKRIYPVTSITIPEKYQKYYMGVESTFNLGGVVTVNPDNATTPDVVYSSSDAMIAEVNEYGEVYTKALGDVTITVKAVDGSNVSATCEVYVRDIDHSSLLDRTNWTVTTSHDYFSDGVINGAPECLIDDDEKSCLALVKPGKLTIGKDESVFFVIDMQTPQNFDFFVLRHRTYQNTTANLRVTKVSVYGSNDGENYTEVIKEAPIATAATISSVTVDLPENVSYRYFKLTYDGWSNSGNTIQISDFNIGNKKFMDYTPEDHSPEE